MTANIVDTIVRGVSCFCFHCEGLPGPDGFHIAAIQLLKDLGMIFLETAPFPRAPDPNPFAQLDATGNVYGGFIMATHSLLQPSVKAWNLEEYFECGYGGAVLDRSFKLGFGSLREDMPHYKSALQDMANGRREFLKLVIPHVAPRLAFADDAWNHGSVKDRHLADADLRRLFWTTYFGPCFVETHGLEFLMNTPAWRVEELAGGVFVTVTESYLDFAENEPKATLKYLRQKFKSIRPNRFKIPDSF